MPKPIIHLASDHRGYCLKYEIKKYLQQKKITVTDHGNYQYNSLDDYPEWGSKVCKVLNKKNNRDYGILICGTGAGMNILANKYQHIRSAVCWNSKIATLARSDDDINILVLPADFITNKEAQKTIQAFLKNKFKNKIKYIRRLKQIQKLTKCKNES